ncbi:MAG: SGNH/GDSL hydrolase family protein [Clostridium sp.]
MKEFNFFKEVKVGNQIEIEENIADTDIIKGSKFDAEKLRLIQSQLLGDLMWKLRNNLACVFTFQGDSLTYGYDITSTDKRPPSTDSIPDGSNHTTQRASKTIVESFNEAMNEVYPSKITTINRGYSGDYCSRSYTRWNKKHNGDITIFMLGTNDSRHSNCPYVGNVKEYIRWYEQLIIRELLWGKAVILMKSPRNLHANDMRIQAFSLAVDNLGKKYNCPVIDISNFISSYHVDIWSDDTPDNTNNIRTHFTGKGYEIIGKRLASLFVADGLYRKNSVANGSTLLIREQVDGIKYINNSLNLEVNTAYTPQERTVGKSIISRMGTGSKVAYSFYSEQDDLYVIPTLYCYANKLSKMRLDFGIKQPEIDLTTKYIPMETNGVTVPSEITIGTTFNKVYHKNIFIQDNLEPLRILKKGWHTLIIESEDAILSGLEFISKSEFDLLKKQFVVNNEGGLLSVRYNDRYCDLIGKIQIPMPSKVNVVEITGIPSNFTILNKFVTINNKLTDSYCAIYTENNKHYIEVTNNGTQAEGRVAFVDYRIFGYFN